MLSLEGLENCNERLTEQLRQREFHLAELIDEVVYATAQRDEALRHLHTQVNTCVHDAARHFAPTHATHSSAASGTQSMKDVVRSLLQLQTILFSEVVLPLLLRPCVGGQRHESSAGKIALRYESVRHSLEAYLAEPSVSQPTKQLAFAVLREVSMVVNSSPAALAVPQTPSSCSDTSPDEGGRSQGQMERALALSAQLLGRQNEMLALLGEAASELATDAETPDGVQRRRRARSEAPGNSQRVTAQEPACDVIGLQLLTAEANVETLTKKLADSKAALEYMTDEKRRIERSLADAHRCTMEEQVRSEELRRRVAELEAQGLDRAHRPAPPPPLPSPPPQPSLDPGAEALSGVKAGAAAVVQSLREEILLMATSREIQRTAFEAEIATLRHETEADVRRRQLLPPPPPSESQKRHSYEQQEHTARLEAAVASLREELQVMAARDVLRQQGREEERRRLLRAHEEERERLRQERDECQQLLDHMTEEVQSMAAENRALRADLSINCL